MQLSETCRERLQRSAEKVIEVDITDRILEDKLEELCRKFAARLREQAD